MSVRIIPIARHLKKAYSISPSIRSLTFACHSRRETLPSLISPAGLFACSPLTSHRVPSLTAAFSTGAILAGGAKMEDLEVVPDVIDVAPSATIKIEYDSGVEVSGGNELTPTQVQNQPTKVEWPVEAGALYTLCMTDPDAPSRKNATYREWHHWLVVNIPGTDISKGEVLSEYVGSGPPPETGLHRYVFLVYKQSGHLNCDEPRLTNRSAEKREKFAIRKFAAKYNLGQPIAGNVYQAQYDDYVPKLYKQLGA